MSAQPALKVEPAALDYRTGEMDAELSLWRGESGEWVRGKRAYFTGDGTLDVKLQRYGSGQDDPTAVGVWVEFSVPNRVNGHNFDAVTLRETREAMRGVQKQLDDIGIKTNLHTAALSRVDIKNTVETNEPFGCYKGLFEMLQMRAQAPRDYGTTFLWANSRQQVTCYDKGAEMAAKLKKQARRSKEPVKEVPYSGHWTNFEQRFAKPDKVQSQLDMKNVGDLLRGYERVPETFTMCMKKHFFGTRLRRSRWPASAT